MSLSPNPTELAYRGKHASYIDASSGETPLIKVRTPWVVLSELVQHFRNGGHTNAEFWWQMTAPILGVMMEEAGYDVQSQYWGLIFHLRYIIPRLGPAPVSRDAIGWRSFMTDDYSPVEYSWNWDSFTEGPKVRYSVEAIGPNAGSSVDPFNQTSTLGLCSQLSKDFPGMEWSWFNILHNTFCDRTSDPTSISRSAQSSSSSSSLFMAFELGSSVATKAYFVPVKAEQHGVARLSILTEAIENLRGFGLPFKAYDTLLDFSKTRQGSKLDIVGVAIDCVKVDDSRFKIYVRSPETSFDSVCEMMTLGGSIHMPTELARQELKALWYLTLGLDAQVPETEELPYDGHETSGVLFNFDIMANHSVPLPKLYIPVKHYARNDLEAAQGLGVYLRSRGKAKYFENYRRVLERTCLHRGLGDGRGVQTYIGTGFRKDGSLSLCSYLNGEVYHPARWNS